MALFASILLGTLGSLFPERCSPSHVPGTLIVESLLGALGSRFPEMRCSLDVSGRLFVRFTGWDRVNIPGPILFLSGGRSMPI